jgi:RNA polymerase sigma-70 factor, ECF subfamily
MYQEGRMIQDIATDTFTVRTRDGAPPGDGDESLVARVISGSEEALAALYDRHAGTVFRAAMRVTRDAGAAAEVVQETFLVLWNRAEQFDSSRGQLSTWLGAVARNRSIDYLRAAMRRDRAASFSSFDGPADDPAVAERLTANGALIAAAVPDPVPEVAFALEDCREWIAGMVDELAPLERRVIALAYTEGLSQSEIADALGWPIGTVKTRTRRGLRRLRESMESPTLAVTPCA